MKKTICLFLILILVLSVSGCAAKTSLANENEGAVVAKDLFENASPQTSALGFFRYDGETTNLHYLFPAGSVRKVLDELAAVPAILAEKWSPAQITLPVYGINIMDSNGNPLEAAWSNGYLIMQDGNAYRFDYDFAKLTERYTFSQQGTWNSATILPSAEHLFKHDHSWHKMLMKEAKEFTSCDEIDLTITKAAHNAITVHMLNHTDHELTYGESFSLQAKLDDHWYDIPTASGTNWAFTAIAYLLPSHGEATKTYPLDMYGTLPDGNYRILINVNNYVLTAEFFVKGDAVSDS